LISKNVKYKIYRTIILPVVLYKCETRSLTLREEGRLRVFENRVLRSIFGHMRYGFWLYTECLRRNVPDFGRVFLMLKYTDITQNTYVQS